MNARSKKFPFLGIMTCLSLITFIPMAISFYFYQAKIKQLEAYILEDLSTQTEGVAVRAETWLDMNIRMLRQNAAMDDIISMQAPRQIPILKSVTKNYGDSAHSSFTVKLDGKNLARSDNETLKDFKDRGWFQQALQGGPEAYGVDIQVGRTSGTPTCTIGVPILDRDQKKVGVIVASSKVNRISGMIANTKIGETGFSYVLNKKGRFVAHYKKEVAEGVSDFSKHPTLTELGNETKKIINFIDPSTQKRTIAALQRTKHDWIAVVQQNYDEAFAPIIKAKRQALILLGIALFVIFGMVYLFVRHLRNESQAGGRRVFIKTFLAMVVIGLSPLVTYEGIHYFALKENLSMRVQQMLSSRSDTLTDYVENWVDMHQRILVQNASREAGASMDPKKLKPILLSIVKEYPWTWASISGIDGQQIVRSNNEALKNYADRHWFQEAMKGKIGDEIVISKTFGKPVWSVAAPIMDKQQKVVGVFSIVSSLSNISEHTTNTKIGKTGFAYLLTDKGKLVAHQKKPYTQALLDFSQQPAFTRFGASANKVSFSTKEENSRKDIISYAQKTKQGWVTVIQQDVAEGLELVHNTMKSIFLLLGVVLLGILVASLGIARWINPRQES